MRSRNIPLILAFCVAVASCGSGDSSPLQQTLSSSQRLLFVASGNCYGGGVTLSTASQTIVAFDLNKGALHHTLVDYGVFSPGDSPVSITEYDADNLLVLVENAAGRRIDLLRKDGSHIQTFISNATALSAVLRAIHRNSDGTVLASKSSAVEKFAASKARLTQGANPWISAPTGSCATSTTLISGLDTFSNGKIFFTHAAATPNNKIALISATGYAAAGDCLAGTAGPTTTALPTSVVIHPSGKTLVTYGSTTAASNFIYSYDVNSTANTISGATAAYTNTSVINGPSAMAVNPDTGLVYVANALSTFNTIEEFSLSGGTLTRTRSTPFAGPMVYTRCVSSMKVLGYSQ